VLLTIGLLIIGDPLIEGSIAVVVGVVAELFVRSGRRPVQDHAAADRLALVETLDPTVTA
jgi:hypothetical protein